MHNQISARFEVIMTVSMVITVSWDMTISLYISTNPPQQPTVLPTTFRMLYTITLRNFVAPKCSVW